MWVFNSIIYHSFPSLLYIEKRSHTRIPRSFLSHEAVQHPCSLKEAGGRHCRTSCIPQGGEHHTALPLFTGVPVVWTCFSGHPESFTKGKTGLLWAASKVWFPTDPQGMFYSDSVSYFLSEVKLTKSSKYFLTCVT